MMYWTQRINSQSNVLFDKIAMETDGQLAKYYQTALSQTQIDMERLYDKLVEEGLDTDRTIDLYRFERFYRLRNQLRDRLMVMGQAEQRVLDKKFEKMYNGVQDVISKNAPGIISNSFVMPGRAEQILRAVWCADGKHWSERVWGNMAKLQQRIEQGLIDQVVAGRSKSQMIEQLKRDFGVGFREADRLVRTELNYVQNQSAADRYEAAGIHEYQILATMDARTSEICYELNGKTFQFTDAIVGENMPPLHPNCRSTIVPVIKG